MKVMIEEITKQYNLPYHLKRVLDRLLYSYREKRIKPSEISRYCHLYLQYCTIGTDLSLADLDIAESESSILKCFRDFNKRRLYE